MRMTNLKSSIQKDYPWSCFLYDQFAAYIERSRSIPENEVTDILNKVHDALLSYLNGRSLKSFERGLEDEMSELQEDENTTR